MAVSSWLSLQAAWNSQGQIEHSLSILLGMVLGTSQVAAVMTVDAKGCSVRMFNEHTDAFLLVGCLGRELLGQSRPGTSLKRWSDYCRWKV